MSVPSHSGLFKLLIWKTSAWLGTGIMIIRETTLAKIVGQMSLSKSTDVSTQSWVFISVYKNMILQTGKMAVYT